MNGKIYGVFVLLLILSIASAFYLINYKQVCKVVQEHRSLGDVVLYTSEAEELYGISQPMNVHLESIENTDCQQGIWWRE